MANGHGGSRPGSGRKPLTAEEKAARRAARRAATAMVGTAAAVNAEAARRALGDPAGTGTALATIPKKRAGGDAKARAAASSLEKARAFIRLTDMSNAAAERRRQRRQVDPFQLPSFPPMSTPKRRNLRMAMDQNLQWASNEWAAGAGAYLGGVAAEGLIFLGYPYLSELAQRPEYRTFSETIADDATRSWIDFELTGTPPELQGRAREDEEDPEGAPDRREQRLKAAGKMAKVKEIKDEMARLELRDHMYAVCRDDGFYGRSHLYVDLGVNLDGGGDEELKAPIGNGRDELSRGKVGKGSLKALKVIEPVWTYPTTYNAINPLRHDWYNPQVWYVMGKEIHSSRLLPFIGHPVPDLLKPAYSFGGVSLSQLAKPYVDIWLKTRKSIGDLIHAFSVMVLPTDMSTMVQPGGSAEMYARADAFNALRDNNSIFMINKNTEDFKNVSVPLSGLHELQAQSQEHMCVQAGTRITTTRGQIPVEDVNTADLVLTRAGFSPIKWVGVTGLADTLVEIEAGDSVLRVTEEHPIWSESTNAFVSARNVSPSHHLVALKTIVQVSTANQSRGAVGGGGEQSLDTTGIRRPADSFIASCGKRIEAQYQMAMRSITRMMMERTIAGIILSSSRVQSTWSGTAASAALSSASMPSSAHAAERLSPRLGRGLSIVLAHARRALTSFVMDGSPSRPTPRAVNAAEQSSRPSGKASLSFVLARACSVPVGRVATISVPRQPVYDIEVDGPPEFFANGILVHNSSVSRIPLVKLTGISPSGLNASSEGELRSYYDTIAAYQNRFMRPHLTRVLNFVQLSLYGEIDPEITFIFKPLWEMSEKEKSELQKADAERDQVYVDMGAIAPKEVRQHIVDDPELPYSDLDPDDVPELREEEEEGLVPRGSGRAVEGLLEEGPGAGTGPK
jgi:hypothetical protein